MPAYNAGKYIAETIESVKAQTYEDWELIIVDDESVDNTAEVVKGYALADGRISYHWQKNGKQGKTRNAAIAKATGHYVAFLDADDVWLPDKLHSQVQLIEEKKVDLVFGYAFVIEDGIKTSRKVGRGAGFYQGEDAVAFLLYHDAFVISTVMTKLHVVREIDGFLEDEKIQFCEDWHFWLKIALNGYSIYNDESVVGFYRVHGQSSAMVEMNAKVKFYYALLDLYYRYPTHEALRAEVGKRAAGLIFHNASLPVELIDSIIAFLSSARQSSVWLFFYKPVYNLNVKLFRKFAAVTFDWIIRGR